MYLGIIVFVFGFVFEIIGSSFFAIGFKKIDMNDPDTLFSWIDSGSATLLTIALLLVLAVSIFAIVQSVKIRQTNERSKGTIGLGFSIASTALSALFGLLFLVASFLA